MQLMYHKINTPIWYNGEDWAEDNVIYVISNGSNKSLRLP